jgi:glycerol-3-phosphate dehydrogenase (NAD(P)+)
MSVEGITTAPVLRELGSRLGIELPITDAVCEVLDGESPRLAVAELMERPPTGE